ncbi:MAG: hypothetical protein AAF718_08060 [Pseudomonadota bacterium]
MSVLRQCMTVLVVSVLLVACQEGDTEETAADPAIPDILAPQRAACENDGGRWLKVPNRDSFACFRWTRDANKACSSARDCQGLCLARSRTCAPQTPLFGCHEILSAAGLRQTLCTE